MMQRSHLTLGLAVLVAALWSTQCNSLSDDCKKTLTCGDDAGAPRLNPVDCTWRFPDGGEWKDGPRRVNGRWEWPNGEPAPTFNCSGNGGGGSNGSDNCTNAASPASGEVRCDPLQCDTETKNCVQCLNDTHCANQADASAGPTLVCDTATHRCIECLVDRDCAGTGTPYCQLSDRNSSLNECVSCLRDADCSSSEVCDEPTGECTLRCSTPADCPDAKPICSIPSGTAEGVCVECLNDTTCSGGTPECNISTKECVPCVTNAPCGVLGRVCDTTANECVRCLADEHCQEEAATQRCDTIAHSCVECLENIDCTDVAESRCNPGTHTCETCTADEQCEPGAAKCRVADGQCVACIDDSQCPGARCDLTSGTCVECTSDTDCPLPDAARCDLTLNSPTRFQCVRCNATDANGFAECSGKTPGGLCRGVDGLCVNCLDNGGCVPSGPTLSRCNGAGNCAACAVDGDCDLFAGRRACRVNAINPGCVECVTDNHCSGNADGPRCKTTAGGGTGAINTCVECLSNADCTDPTKSFCDGDNKCVACVDNDECSHLANLTVCDTSGASGVCVQCTGLQRQACGANVCNSLTRTCTANGVGTATLCTPCVSDPHCEANARCVEESFPGVNDGLYFCVPLQASGVCPRGFAQPALGRATIDQTASVCLPETTCPAYNHYLGAQSCVSAADDAACGIAGVADGLCVTSTTGFVCTIPCDSGNDCIATALCDPTGAFCQP